MNERRFLVQLLYYAFRRDVKPDITTLTIGANLLEFLQRNQGTYYYEVNVLKEVLNELPSR